jgi:ubiquinone biosynthesis protein
MGTLSDRDRSDAISFYTAVISMEPDSIVDLLVRMKAVNYEVDRRSLERDIERVLQKYYGGSMGDIRIRELANLAMPIINRYHLRLPPNWGLLLQTLGMMQGIALTLDPGFDVWEFSVPYIRKVAWRLALPKRDWAQSLLRQSQEWSDLISNLPRIGNRMLEQAGRGDLMQIGLKDTGLILKQLDRLTTRLVLSLLLAALTISLALVAPLATAGSPLQLPVTVAFGVAVGLILWLFISVLTGTR